MHTESSIVGSLAALMQVQSERDAIATILDGLVHMVDGHHYSAVYESIGCSLVDLKLRGGNWLGVDHEFSRSIAELSHAHPFAIQIRRKPVSVTLVRSHLMEDSAWHRTEIYQMVDAPLEVADMIGIYFNTPAGHLCGALCGRRSAFTEQEVGRVDQYRQVANRLLKGVRAVSSQSDRAAIGRKGLSKRESEIMDLVTTGKDNREIALVLGISRHTVRKHLENIFLKLSVSNRTRAAMAWKHPK